MDVDDEFNFDDDFSLGDEDYIRILEKEENQYHNSQFPQDNLLITTTEQQQPQMDILKVIEEPEMPDLVTRSPITYDPHETQVIEDDFNFDLQRQGYRTESSITVRDDVMVELNKLKRERTLKDFKIETLETEVAKLRSRLKRDDTPMQDSSDASTLESKIFPNIGDFSVKRLDYEGSSTNNKMNRPMKRTMTRSVTPALIMHLPKQSQFASQKMDTQISKAPITPTAPVTIDYKKTERQNKFLAILLGDSFLKWRRNAHIQLGTGLTKNQIHELCQLEAKNLLPSKSCNTDSRKRLGLIAADFSEIMLTYESNDMLPKLFNSFRLSLTFALKENQHAIIIYIISKIKLLTDTFDEAIHILYNELTRMDTTSTLFFVVMSLKLFYADINPGVPTNLASHLPNVKQLTLEQLKKVTDDYSTMPDTISKIVKERISPESAKKGTYCVLQIILNISKRVRQPFFVWLLNNESFTELLSKNTPYGIILNALSVIELYTVDNILTVFKDVKEIYLFKKMADLLQTPPPDISFDQIFQFRERIILILQKIAKMALPLVVLKYLYKQVVPVLLDLIKKEMSESSIHLYSLSTDKREKSILSRVCLLALLSQYSSYDLDDKYPPSALEEFIVNVYNGLDDDHDRPMIQQIKEQLEYIKNQLKDNVIIL